MPMPLPPPPIGPPFERPDDWEPERFPWAFTVKAGLSALLVSVALTSMLLFGVTVWIWTCAWGATLLWIIAGSILIGLVRWKGDTWWIGELDVGRRVNRGTVLLGLTLLVLPTGFGRWSWTAFGPVSPAVTPLPEQSAVATASSAPGVGRTVPSAPTTAPTPTTCGTAVVNAPRGLRLRAGPGTTEAIIATLPQHTPLALLCSAQDAGGIRWANVRTGAGEGWVAEEIRGQRYLIRP